MGERSLDDRLTTIGGPYGLSTDPQAVMPVGQAEAAQAKDGLQFGRVFAPGLVALRIASESRSWNGELGGDKVEKRRGRLLPGIKALVRMAQQAELHGKPKAVYTAALGAHSQEGLWAEHAMPGQLGRRNRDIEKAGALLGGQKGTAGHGTSAGEKAC